MGHPQHRGAFLGQEFRHRGAIGIVFAKGPIGRCLGFMNHKAAAVRIVIRGIRGDPEIDIDGGEIGMRFDALKPRIIFVSP